jgi:hypothetical protein
MATNFLNGAARPRTQRRTASGALSNAGAGLHRVKLLFQFENKFLNATHGDIFRRLPSQRPVSGDLPLEPLLVLFFLHRK